MLHAVQNFKAPVFFFQAANDYDLTPSRVLSDAMEKAGKISLIKIYPAYGGSADEGHTFGYADASVWIEDVMQFLTKHCTESYGPVAPAESAATSQTRVK